MTNQRDQNDEFIDRLKAVECRDATYPARAPALVFERGLGSEVWDVAGRRYIDLCAGFGVLALGHNHPSFSAALAESSRRYDVVHGMGDVHPSRAKVELLENLTALVPGLTRAALALTGAQAVELAAKTAMLGTKKSGFITLAGGYHGLDLGILPLTSREDFRAPFADWLPANSVERVAPFSSAEILAAARTRLDANGAGLAAVIVEPVQGRAGGISLGIEWLSALRKFCDATGALLIYDEVFTGLGRSGRMSFASSVPCDLLCLGKALGGGLPLSACLGTEAAMQAWPESRGEAIHTGTFFGHALSCQVALTTLAEIKSQKLPQRAASLGDIARKKLVADLPKKSCVAEIRGEGLMLVIDCKLAGAGARLMDLLRAKGVIALASGSRGECLQITPALNIPEALLNEGLARLTEAAAEL